MSSVVDRLCKHLILDNQSTQDWCWCIQFCAVLFTSPPIVLTIRLKLESERTPNPKRVKQILLSSNLCSHDGSISFLSEGNHKKGYSCVSHGNHGGIWGAAVHRQVLSLSVFPRILMPRSVQRWECKRQTLLSLYLNHSFSFLSSNARRCWFNVFV